MNNAIAEESAESWTAGGSWWHRPTPPWVVAAMIGVVLLVPAWNLMDELRNFTLFGDDFVYIGQSRDWPTTLAHLWRPHNTHVVPLFRLWTFMMVVVAGRLEFLPAVLAAASYVGLAAAMLAMGHLVARETGRTDVGIAAMAVLGISTVTYPAVTWYSAGQALWAGTAIVVTIALARNWSAKGGTWRFAALALGTVLAPFIWSGGLVAGPAAMAYLLASKASRVRRPMLLLAGITVALGLLVLALSWRNLAANVLSAERQRDLWPRPIQAVLHTAQALIEECTFGNLGIDAFTTPWQDIALLVALAALCFWARVVPGRISPLEAAGATIAVGSLVLAYTLRGNLAYSGLRTFGWYYAIPQLGTILFAAGWWTALTAPEPGRMTVRQAVGALGLALVFFAIQLPRREQQILQSAPPLLTTEAPTFPTRELRLQRAAYYKSLGHGLQVRALARLDRIDRILSQIDASPETLRDIMGRVLIPGIPEKEFRSDAFSLLTQRPRNANALAAVDRLRPELSELLQPEAPPVPFWFDPDDHQTRSIREVSKIPLGSPAPR